MKTLLKVGMIISLSVLTSSLTYAGVNQWTTVGPKPPGSILYTLIVDPHTPSTLYALSDGRVFKSTNGGSSWSPVSVAAEIVDSLTLDPLTPTTLFAGTGGGGARVFKSTNGGATWVALNVPTTEAFDSAVVVIDSSTGTTTTLYATFIASGNVFGGIPARQQLLRSVDGGATWTILDTPPADNPLILPVATCPTNPAIRYGKYASTGGLIKSNNGGVSWSAFGNLSFFVDPVIDPQNPAILYANGFFDATLTRANGEESPVYIEGVFRSTDCGESWSNLGTLLQDQLLGPLTLDPTTSTLYLGTPSSILEFRLANPSPEILAWVEGPEHGQTVSGMGIIRGWAFVTRPGVQVHSGLLLIDGRPNSALYASFVSLPCCADRDDVQAAFPQFPAENTLKSGWGTVYSWGQLSAGRHEIQVGIRSTAGDVFISAPRTVTVVKPGDFGFLDQLQISGAGAEIRGEELVLSGVTARAGNTQKRINARYRWRTDTQSLEVVQTETTATLSSWRSALSTLMVSLSGSWKEYLSGVSSAQAASGIISYFESPVEGQTAAGMSIIRGWAFPEAPEAAILRVQFSVDGRHLGTTWCCSDRDDVAGVYNIDRTNAWFSGWSIPVNYSDLEPGVHTITVQLEASNGITQTLTRRVETIRIGGFPFLDQFNLTDATAKIDGEEIVLSGVLVRDKASQQTKVIEVRLRWFVNSQSLGIVASSS